MKTASIPRLLLLFGIPGMLLQLVQISYIVIDTAFVGRALGEIGLAALALCGPPVMILVAISGFVVMGAGIIHNQKLGSGDTRGAAHVAMQSCVLVFITYIEILIVTFVVIIPSLEVFSNSDDVHDLAVRYLTIHALGLITQGFGYTFSGLLAGCGHPKLQLGLHGAAAGLNVVLDYVFLMGMGLGIEWAAIATVIAWTVPAILGLIFFLRGKAPYCLNTKDLRPNKKILLTACGFGAPILLMNLGTAFHIGVFIKLIAVSAAMSPLTPTEALAMSNVASRAYQVLLIPLLGVGMGCAPVLAYNFGGRAYRRLVSLFRGIIVASGLAVIVMWIPTLIWSHSLATLFGISQAGADLAGTYIRLEVLCAPLGAIYLAVAFLCQNIGKQKQASILMMGFSVLVVTPVTALAWFVLPKITPLNQMTAVYAGLPIAEVILLILGVALVAPILKELNRKIELGPNAHDTLQKAAASQRQGRGRGEAKASAAAAEAPTVASPAASTGEADPVDTVTETSANDSPNSSM